MTDDVTSWSREIEAGARTMGLDVSTAQADAMAMHLVLVDASRATLNLTTIPREQYVPAHVLDSLSVLPDVLTAPRGAVCDLGSGAGFPGIPLGIASRRRLHLVESVKKKARFLERATAELCLEATVHPLRAEELAVSHANVFSVVVARAVASLPALVELGAPLLSHGGLLVCMKGDPDATELNEGRSVARIVGLREEKQSAVAVPGLDARRTIVVYRKVGPSDLRLPRRCGQAQRSPLVDRPS